MGHWGSRPSHAGRYLLGYGQFTWRIQAADHRQFIRHPDWVEHRLRNCQGPVWIVYAAIDGKPAGYEIETGIDPLVIQV